MDETQVKHVLEAALLAAGRPLSLDTLASLFATKASELDKTMLKAALDALAEDYRERGIELKEVASGYRIQIRRSMSDWLTPLWEERAPRYTRALLETLALVAYRQPITRAEIEEVRGVAVSTNIIRTLMERNWIRVVGHRDVPGKPAMFGTTKEFLDYFGLRKLEDLPPLADIKDGLPELSPQSDLIDALVVTEEGGTAEVDADAHGPTAAAASEASGQAAEQRPAEATTGSEQTEAAAESAPIEASAAPEPTEADAESEPTEAHAESEPTEANAEPEPIEAEALSEPIEAEALSEPIEAEALSELIEAAERPAEEPEPAATALEALSEPDDEAPSLRLRDAAEPFASDESEGDESADDDEELTKVEAR